MICPSCNEALPDISKHCVHCGIAITGRSVLLAKVVNNGGWVARRALGGFFAGAAGMLVSAAVARTISYQIGSTLDFSQLLTLFPGQMPLPTAIAGCFIGTVGGIIERSAYKTFLGGTLGALGGIIGGLCYPFFDSICRGYIYYYSLSMSGSWSIIGAMIGLASGLMEGTRSKITAGILGGLLGGLCGGAIGSQMYGALLMEVGNAGKMPWFVERMLEFAAGGIIGVNIWAFLGLSEKMYIFRRRQLAGASTKVCDHCHAENILSAWYCAQCGSALQVAAAREQIRVTPYTGLERISNAFQFLSWLSASAGVVISIVVFVIFIMQNFFFALFGSLLAALIIYSLSVTFRALSDSLKIWMQIAEKPRENTDKIKCP